MIRMKIMKAKAYFSGGLLICSTVMSFQVCAATSASAEVQITVTSPRPSCNLTVQQRYNLGPLPLGEWAHPTFPVRIDCVGWVRTALTARNTTGTLQTDNYRVAIPLGSTTNSRGPFLWLKNKAGRNIKLTGTDSEKFCNDWGGQNRVCDVTPVTDVKEGASYGKGSVSILFSIVYPA